MLTPGLLSLHHRGLKGGRDAALIDIAQDHALKILYDKGIFELGTVFKGGTSLKKFRSGNSGRYSTDLDFAVPEIGVAELILETLDGAALNGFTFKVEVRVEAKRAFLLAENPALGAPPRVPPRIDINHTMPWLQPEVLSPIPLPIHRAYAFELPNLPIIRLEELISEKLARFRRKQLARDLYDLAWCANRPFNETLVKRLTALKVWSDVAREELGEKPFDPGIIIANHNQEDFSEDGIGFLIQSVDIPQWINTVRARYAFITDLHDDEQILSRCSLGDTRLAQRLMGEFTQHQNSCSERDSNPHSVATAGT